MALVIPRCPEDPRKKESRFKRRRGGRGGCLSANSASPRETSVSPAPPRSSPTAVGRQARDAYARGDERELRGIRIAGMRWLRWFIAGAIAVPAFHQVALYVLHVYR